MLSCNGTENNNIEQTTVIEDTDDMNTIDLSEYVIVRPDSATKATIDICNRFSQDLKEKTGIDFPYKTDYLKEGTPYFTETEKEILIGETNREESSLLFEGHKLNDYVIGIVGTKIVINAGNHLSLEAAMERFLNEFVVNNSSTIDSTMSVTYKYEDEFYISQLEGIKMKVIGDSYFGGSSLGKEAAWPSLLARKYKMDFINYGVGGSTVSNFVTDRRPMCERYKDMKSGADIVIFQGGRNDFNQKVPLGDINSYDTKTFAGAVNVLIDGLEAKYPQALLIGVTAWYVNDEMYHYSEMMKAICEKRGIVCFDAANQKLSGVYMDDPVFRATYCLSPTDVSHLNHDGMMLVLPVFEKFIGEKYIEFVNKN